jgi:adenosine deaminase
MIIFFFYRDSTDGQILAKLMVSVDRQQGQESASETLDAVLAAHYQNPKLIVGLDLSGDPTKGLLTDYLPILAHARNAGLKISIHCAEVGICGHSVTSHTGNHIIKETMFMNMPLHFSYV